MVRCVYSHGFPRVLKSNATIKIHLTDEMKNWSFVNCTTHIASPYRTQCVECGLFTYVLLLSSRFLIKHQPIFAYKREENIHLNIDLLPNGAFSFLRQPVPCSRNEFVDIHHETTNHMSHILPVATRPSLEPKTKHAQECRMRTQDVLTLSPQQLKNQQ